VYGVANENQQNLQRLKKDTVLRDEKNGSGRNVKWKKKKKRAIDADPRRRELVARGNHYGDTRADPRDRRPVGPLTGRQYH
jgi:hypothetical protein